MTLKSIVYEDFVNYKEPVMYLGTAYCDGKCCKEANEPFSMCQNNGWRETASVAIADEKIIERYLVNDITNGVCFSGLEPFMQFEEMFNLISKLRYEHSCNDVVIIYTGYDREEIADKIKALQMFKNVIVKFGRYIPNAEKHFDEVLGIYLASPNQYAEKIS